jgi:hypothetical protein
VQRVVRAFNGEMNIDGVSTGVVGDLKDTIRAILLDVEARSATSAADPGFGKQREPLLRLTGPVRTFLPTVIPNSTYRQIGGQQMMITTPTPHRLVNGDIALLDTFVDSGSSTTNLPSAIGYTVTIPTYTFTNSSVAYSSATTTATISGSNYVAGNQVYLKFSTGGLSGGTFDGLYTIVTATAANFTVTLAGSPPASASGNSNIVVTSFTGNGYQIGDTIPIQFTSGNLNVSPYNSVNNYTVTGITYSSGGPSGFTVNAGSPSITGGTGSAVFPNNFTVNNAQTASSTYTIGGTGNQTVTMNFGVNVVTGHQIYLKFISGSLYNAGFDGLYTIATFPDSSHITVQLASSPGGTSGGTVLYPKYTGGYNITNNGSTSTISVQTNTAHGLKVGDSVWIDFLVSNGGANPAVSQAYTVVAPPAGALTSPNLFYVTVTPAVTAGSQSTSGQAVYPLYSVSAPPPWNRNGTCTLEYSTWNIGGNTSVTQIPLDSPTVFNFFYPNFEYPGILAAAGMTTPEFQLTNDSNTMNLTNILENAAVNGANTNGFASFINANGSLVMDFGSYVTVSATSNTGIPGTVDAMAAVLVGGSLNSNTRTAIINYVANTTNFPLGSPPTNAQMANRIRAILHLIITSAEYAIQK